MANGWSPGGTAQELALDAVGNPTRRAVLRLLRDGEHTVREMTDALPVTQSAVSQHLRVLHTAGLVTVRAAGTRRLYAVDLDGLAGVRAWVDSFWDDVLTAFVSHAEATGETETVHRTDHTGNTDETSDSNDTEERESP